MMTIPAQPWIAERLANKGVAEEGKGKWKAVLRGEEVGTFKSKAEALKAYRAAAEKKFGRMAALPSDADIDAAIGGEQ